MLDAPCPGLRRRAARIAAHASGGAGRSFAQGDAPAALPEPEPILSPAAIARIEARLRDLLSGHALDGDVALRDPTRFFVHEPQVSVVDHDPEAIFAFRGADATERMDAILALADIAQLLPMPAIQEAGKLLRSAIRAYVEDAEPLHRSLGIAPASGKTGRHGSGLDRRNALILHVRHAVSDWRNLSDRQSAAAIIADFKRYRATATRWGKHKGDKSAVPYEPDATFWRLCKLPLSVDKQMPGLTTVTNILRGEGGG